MLHPSYSELIDVLNSDSENEQVTSRYTIVIAAAKRARQLVDGAQKVTDFSANDKAVSIAVNEMNEGKIKIIMDEAALAELNGMEEVLTGFEKKLDEKTPKLSLNFNNFDDDELDEYDDFDDDIEEESDEEEDSELLIKGLMEADEEEFDDAEFEEAEFEFEEEQSEDDSSYDDDDSYGN
jgi:DNA-directed RNA polymerase subunit omega